ncbi:MAG: hypothetical protein CMH41_10390, partial [Micrococcales bacterium]|nr:hypothetical protein [Micrococcales bacterium]
MVVRGLTWDTFYNGRVGSVTGYDRTRDRYFVDCNVGKELNVKRQHLRILPKDAGTLVECVLPQGILNAELLHHVDALAVSTDCSCMSPSGTALAVSQLFSYADPCAGRVASTADPCVATLDTCPRLGTVLVSSRDTPSASPQPAVAFLHTRACAGAAHTEAAENESAATGSRAERCASFQECLQQLPSALPPHTTSIAFSVCTARRERKGQPSVLSALRSFARTNPQLRVVAVDASSRHVATLRREHVRRRKRGSAARHEAIAAQLTEETDPFARMLSQALVDELEAYATDFHAPFLATSVLMASCAVTGVEPSEEYAGDAPLEDALRSAHAASASSQPSQCNAAVTAPSSLPAEVSCVMNAHTQAPDTSFYDCRLNRVAPRATPSLCTLAACALAATSASSEASAVCSAVPPLPSTQKGDVPSAHVTTAADACTRSNEADTVAACTANIDPGSILGKDGGSLHDAIRQAVRASAKARAAVAAERDDIDRAYRTYLREQRERAQGEPAAQVASAATSSGTAGVVPQGLSKSEKAGFSVSSADGAHIPTRLLNLHILGPNGERLPMPVNIGDTGAATVLLGLSDYEAIRKKMPGAIRRVPRLSTSYTGIRGVSGTGVVLFHVALTLDFDGVPVTVRDCPVLADHSGILIGVDVAGEGQANFSFEKDARFTDSSGVSLPCDGFMQMRDSQRNVVSSLPFVHRVKTLESLRSASLEMNSDVSTAVCASVALAEPAAEDSAVPIAYAPTAARVPGWSQQIIRCRVPAAAVGDHHLAVLPLEDSRMDDIGVCVAPCLQKPDKDGYVWVRVV